MFFKPNTKNRQGGIGGTLLFLAALVLGAIVVVFFLSGDTPTDDDTNNNGDDTQSELITIDSPEAGDEIQSPLLVSGEARGQWYFEANFSVEIKDEAGNVLTEAPVQADGEWMTEEFVPFSEEIEFDASQAETSDGSVVFHRANPSGLEENADSVSVPVTFADTDDAETMNVSVFWSDNAAAAAGDCSVVSSFDRSIPETEGVARAALEELLSGPTEAETQDEYSTNIPDNVSINSLRIEDSVAYADFSSELNEGGGSCRVTAIRAQITETLKQFSTVEEVVISVDGETETALQP